MSAQCHRCRSRLDLTCGGRSSHANLIAQRPHATHGCDSGEGHAISATGCGCDGRENPAGSTFKPRVSTRPLHDGQSGHSPGRRDSSLGADSSSEAADSHPQESQQDRVSGLTVRGPGLRSGHACPVKATMRQQHTDE